jgi:hypothetical protein
MPAGLNNTALLDLPLPVEGYFDGSWGDLVNYSLTNYLDIAIAGTSTFTGDGAVTLDNTAGDDAATNITANSGQYAIIKVAGTLTTTKIITVGTVSSPAVSKSYIVDNAATGGTVTFKAYGQTGISVAVGEKCVVYFNGTDFVKVASSVADGVTSVSGTGNVNGITLTGTVTSTGNLTLGGTLANVNLTSQVTGTLPILNGGTGTTSTTFVNLASNVTGTLPVLNGGTGTTTPALVQGSGVTITGTWPNQTIAATGSGGTITSVTGTAPVASSGGTTPAISLAAAYGDTLNPYASKTANNFLAAPNGSAGVPSFRAVVAADIPTLNQNTTGTAASTPKLLTTNFTIEESGGKLLFKYGATTIASMTSAGVFTTISDITGNGTP